MFSFLFEHPKKVAAAVSLSMAIVGYSGLSRLKALAEPLQEEAQALMIRQASRDMGCVGTPTRALYANLIYNVRAGERRPWNGVRTRRREGWKWCAALSTNFLSSSSRIQRYLCIIIVFQFLNAFAAKLNGLFGLENLVRNLKSTPTTDRAARAALLNDLHLKSACFVQYGLNLLHCAPRQAWPAALPRCTPSHSSQRPFAW